MQKYFTRSLYADDKAMYADMMKYIRQLEQAIIKTIEENRHLADGEDCALKHLVALDLVKLD